MTRLDSFIARLRKRDDVVQIQCVDQTDKTDHGMVFTVWRIFGEEGQVLLFITQEWPTSNDGFELYYQCREGEMQSLSDEVAERLYSGTDIA